MLDLLVDPARFRVRKSKTMHESLSGVLRFLSVLDLLHPDSGAARGERHFTATRLCAKGKLFSHNSDAHRVGNSTLDTRKAKSNASQFFDAKWCAVFRSRAELA